MTTVSRSSSFRKRPLEERKSLDVELELLPSKHERYKCLVKSNIFAELDKLAVEIAIVQATAAA